MNELLYFTWKYCSIRNFFFLWRGCEVWRSCISYVQRRNKSGASGPLAPGTKKASLHAAVITWLSRNLGVSDLFAPSAEISSYGVGYVIRFFYSYSWLGNTDIFVKLQMSFLGSHRFRRKLMESFNTTVAVQ